MLQSDGSYNIVSKESDGLLAYKSIRWFKPDIVILDISMPGMSGLDIVNKITKEGFESKFIILTMYKDEEYFNKAIDLGVRGYILKENAEDELLEALKTVLTGRHYISPMLSEFLIIKNKKRKSIIEKYPTIKNLTPTERKVLKLLAENKTSKEIAKELFISPKTVENHRSNIITKLGLKGRNQLFLFAFKNKFLL